ncbi:MAG: DUF2721 domain-containing protein [Fimbriimonadaceae bacterium]|nr:DUF2721 domain-containing protein [Fimbriimonadaceae bacterium]
MAIFIRSISIVAALAIGGLVYLASKSIPNASLNATVLQQAFTPFAVAAGTILFAMSSRNASISERIRSLGSEALGLAQSRCEEGLANSRLKSIKEQLVLFRLRMELSDITLILQFVTLLAAVATFVASLADEEVVRLPLGIAVFSLLVGSVMCSIEMALAFKTIHSELSFSRKVVDQLSQRGLPRQSDVSVLLSLNNLYHDIWNKQRIAILNSDRVTPEDVKSFYMQFWGLQREQFHLLRHQLVPRDMFVSWMEFRRHEAKKNLELAGISYKVAWAQYRDTHRTTSSDSSFFNLIDRVVDGDEDIVDIVAQEEYTARLRIQDLAEKLRRRYEDIERIKPRETTAGQ